MTSSIVLTQYQCPRWEVFYDSDHKANIGIKINFLLKEAIVWVGQELLK